eukprot:gene9824-257_t
MDVEVVIRKIRKDDTDVAMKIALFEGLIQHAQVLPSRELQAVFVQGRPSHFITLMRCVVLVQ